MWKVRFSSESLSILDLYIEGYQWYFLSRFSDTGIWSEEVIRKNYESDGIKLYDALYDHILQNMTRDLIGYETSSLWLRTTATFLEKRIIFIEYQEDGENHIRYVHTLKIIYR